MVFIRNSSYTEHDGITGSLSHQNTTQKYLHPVTICHIFPYNNQKKAAIHDLFLKHGVKTAMNRTKKQRCKYAGNN